MIIHLEHATGQFFASKAVMSRRTYIYYRNFERILRSAEAGTSLATRPLASIQTGDIFCLIKYIDDVTNFPGLGESSKEKAVKVIKMMFRWFFDLAWIDGNPAAVIRFRKVKPRPTEPYTPAELQSLLALEPHSASDQRDLCMWSVLADTGMRSAELRGLRLADWKGDRMTILRGKGGKSRTVSLGKTTIQRLQAYVGHHRPPSNVDILFVTQEGKAITAGTLAHRLTRWGKLAGVKNAAPHRFRATFATTFIRNGGGLVQLQILLGHETLEMARRYVHITCSEDACLMNMNISSVDKLIDQPTSAAQPQEETPLMEHKPNFAPGQLDMLLRMLEQNNRLILELIGVQVHPSSGVVPAEYSLGKAANS